MDNEVYSYIHEMAKGGSAVCGEGRLTPSEFIEELYKVIDGDCMLVKETVDDGSRQKEKTFIFNFIDVPKIVSQSYSDQRLGSSSSSR
jgi:hypothetical protein